MFGHKEHLDDHLFPETVCERCHQTFRPKQVKELGFWEIYFLGLLVRNHKPLIIHLAHEQRISEYRKENTK